MGSSEKKRPKTMKVNTNQHQLSINQGGSSVSSRLPAKSPKSLHNNHMDANSRPSTAASSKVRIFVSGIVDVKFRRDSEL